MTNVKQAVQAAKGFVGELFPDASGIRLEEVEPFLPSKWCVVLSFNTGEPTTLASVMGGTRLYKAIEIDNESGEPRSLKAWKN